MLKTPLSKILCILAIVATLTAVSAADKPASEALYGKAYEAWDTGDYVTALQGFDTLLRGLEADRYLERIALLTGELYEVMAIAPDGRNLHFSPAGQMASYETGSRAAQVIHVLDAMNKFKPLAEVRGSNAVFSPSGKNLAFLRLNDTPEMEKLRKELTAAEASASTDYMATMNLRSRLSFLEAKASEIVLRDIPSGRETALPDAGVLKGELAFNSDGRELYFVGAKESETASSDIYAAPVGAGPSGGAPRPLTSGPGFKVAPMVVPGGKYIVYSITTRPPFPRPATEPQPARKSGQPDQSGQPPVVGSQTGQTLTSAGKSGQASTSSQTVQPGQASGSGQSGQASTATGQAGQPTAPPRPQRAGAGQSRRFAVLNLGDGSTKAFDGASPVLSPDGSTLVFSGRDGSDNTLNILKLEGDWAPKTIKKTPETVNSAAFSPDGSRISFEMTWTRNTEIFVIGSDGRGEVRLSREIENDRAPRFLSPTRVLAIKGESRYSRAYLYDTEALTSTRLFHNNTIRTLSFEYEWAPDPAGTKILIAAQRNGDTMVPEHGVYLLDLGKKITKETLLVRIKDNLASERALRAKAEAMFKPIAAEVRDVTSAISTTRIYAYEEALFNFDSKHVSRPGNQKAAEYIFKTLESFGYKPEFQWLPNRPMKTANVIAVLKGTENLELYYVISAHYDSVVQGPGADDDSSAMAALLETARVLAGKPLPSSVIFAAFTGEESGLWGSREFARLGKEKGFKVMAGLNNDVIGWMNDNRLDDTIRYSNAGIRDIEHAAALGFTRLITYDTHYVKSTDAVPLYETWGDIMGGLGSYPLLGSPYYHQPSDLLETVNHQLVAEVAKFNTASVMLLASCPSPVKRLKVVKAVQDGTDAVGLTWTPNPDKGISYYLVTWGLEGKAVAGSKKVKMPRAMLKGLKTEAGQEWTVSVKAVNARGLASWDEAKVAVDGPGHK
jgi:Tol biopolymer transport system component